jgi:predicted sulfurtransferase
MEVYVMKRYRLLLSLVVAALVGSLLWAPASAGSIPLMTKEALAPMLDDPNVVILDVRAGRDWKSSEFKIKGAQRANPSDFADWGSTYAKDKKLVLYCA